MTLFVPQCARPVLRASIECSPDASITTGASKLPLSVTTPFTRGVSPALYFPDDVCGQSCLELSASLDCLLGKPLVGLRAEHRHHVPDGISTRLRGDAVALLVVIIDPYER